ncbi:MAG: T9SS type A sorting domain-containing protein, partial [Bacteroidia bacterium]|nr:T9SS type A sorting domain-containing protein [Bacteroidia bacterium]
MNKKTTKSWHFFFCITLIFIYYSPVIGQNGLHGYVASYPAQAPATYGEGYGFYSAIWPLVSTPIANFQIGLPSTWIIPDNSDNSTIPLCPVGTVARDNWPERGPTYSDVFQTVEGGPGYWAGNKFHYGPPKFKMNSTPNCYTQEISTPGWQFFWSDTPLPDSILGIAQISNRILIPPDGMTFQGNPNGELLGISYLSLPLTSAYTDKYPVGEKSWTLFLNALNFKGPLAYYLPETWAKISKDYPFDHGRGLDSRPSIRNLAGGTMEFNTVPIMSANDANQNRYYKIPHLQFPVDSLNRTILSKDVTFYSKKAKYNEVLEWRNGGQAPSGSFQNSGSYRPVMRTYPVNYDQDGKVVVGINSVATPAIFQGNEFGLKWTGNISDGMGSFPAYYKDSANFRVAVPDSKVPVSTGLVNRQFQAPSANPTPYHADLKGSWRNPGPVAGPFFAYLSDHSVVTYFWYRFIDQPVFQQFNWTQGKKDSLQLLIEAMHKNWSIEQDYMKPPSSGNLAAFDPALFVTPPPEFSTGYVPIVVGQEKSEGNHADNNPYNSLPAIEVYPNPASHSLNILLQAVPNANSKLQLMDSTGKILQTVNLHKMSEVLNISSLSNGIYILNYTDGVYSEK